MGFFLNHFDRAVLSTLRLGGADGACKGLRHVEVVMLIVHAVSLCYAHAGRRDHGVRAVTLGRGRPGDRWRHFGLAELLATLDAPSTAPLVASRLLQVAKLCSLACHRREVLWVLQRLGDDCSVLVHVDVHSVINRPGHARAVVFEKGAVRCHVNGGADYPTVRTQCGGQVLPSVWEGVLLPKRLPGHDVLLRGFLEEVACLLVLAVALEARR